MTKLIGLDNLQVMNERLVDISDQIADASSSLLGHNYGAWLDLHAQFLDARESQGLSQRALAAKLGISQPAVSDFEDGSTGIKIQTLLSYASALGLELTLSAKPRVREI